MYEVRKNDYNTVRFLPEYHSGFGNDFQHKQRRKRKKKKIAAVIIIVVLIIAAAAFAVHKVFFSPADKFARAFESSDFTACAEIFSENAYDDKFVQSVKATITEASDAVFDRYKKGDLNSADASALLKNYDTASAEEFASDIKTYSDDITAMEGIKANFETFKTKCSEKNFGDALTTAMELSDTSADYGLDYTDEISDAVIEDFYSFKAEAFYDIAAALSAKDYDKANALCTFMLTFGKDQDFTDEQDTIKKVVAGETRVNTAVREARRIASAAQDQAEKTDPANANDAGDGNNDPEI